MRVLLKRRRVTRESQDAPLGYMQYNTDRHATTREFAFPWTDDFACWGEQTGLASQVAVRTYEELVRIWTFGA